MTPISIVAGSSGAILIALIVLFRYEDARGKRVLLSSVRGILDRAVAAINGKVSRFFRHIGTGAFQATIHFLIHRLLSHLIRVLTYFESYLSRLQLRNKRIANVIRNSESRTHLSEIADHKAETSLSDEERRRRREY